MVMIIAAEIPVIQLKVSSLSNLFMEKSKSWPSQSSSLVMKLS